MWPLKTAVHPDFSSSVWHRDSLLRDSFDLKKRRKKFLIIFVHARIHARTHRELLIQIYTTCTVSLGHILYVLNLAGGGGAEGLNTVHHIHTHALVCTKFFWFVFVFCFHIEKLAGMVDHTSVS